MDTKTFKETWDSLKAKLKTQVPDFEKYESTLDQIIESAESNFKEYGTVIEDFFNGMGSKTSADEWRGRAGKLFDRLRGYLKEDE